MKLGLVADIHANLPALRAVVDELDRTGVDTVLAAGDFTGYYCDVNEVIDLVRHRGWIAVRGNHDEFVLGLREPDAQRSGAYRVAWSSSVLESRHRQWLQGLPERREVELGGRSLILCHGSPWKVDEYVYPTRADWSAFDELDVDAVIMGHTHHPLRRQARHALLLNPGSCGQPRDWDPRAAFMTLDLTTLASELHRVEYDVAALQARLREQGLAEGPVDILNRRRDA